jgi:hypothetical protein
VPVTPAQFRTAYPAFQNVGDGVVQPALDEAYQRTGDSWGELRDAGAQKLAAHLIATDPRAEPSAKSVKTSLGRTVYLAEWERMLDGVRVFGTSVSASDAVGPQVGD